MLTKSLITAAVLATLALVPPPGPGQVRSQPERRFGVGGYFGPAMIPTTHTLRRRRRVL